MLKKFSRHRVKIEKMVYKGWGFSRTEQGVILVKNSYPGDDVECEIFQKKKDYVMAKVVRFFSRSPLKNASICNHFHDCGGCQWLDLDYKDQLTLKSDILTDIFLKPMPDLLNLMNPVLGSKNHTFYRNKMEYAFGSNADQPCFIGLKKRGSFDQIVPTPSCYLMDPEANAINAFTTTFFKENFLPVWDYKTHSGCLRHLIIRHSKHLGQFMLNLIVSENHQPVFQTFADAVSAHFPNVTSVFVTMREEIKGQRTTETSILLKGQPTITEAIGPLQFDISPASFFQTNSKQATVLYDCIAQCVPDKTCDLLLDLYCGTGTIGLYLAHLFKQVIGIEENPHAIQDAKRNQTKNNIKNITFKCGRVKNILKYTDLKPDCIVVDPPRSGMVPKALSRVLALRAPTLIYVSCNPMTLCRDLKEVIKAGYKPTFFQPVDMFPHTYHLEVVVGLCL